MLDAHADFTIKTEPVDHTLCGGSEAITVKPTFNNLALVANGPVTYVLNTRVFTIESSDQSLYDAI